MAPRDGAPQDLRAMRALVLGSTGFLGRLVTSALQERGCEVEGWARSVRTDVAAGTRRVDLAGDAPLPLPLAPWDAAVLVAGPSVPLRFDALLDYARTCTITLRALEHLGRHAPDCRVVVVSSAHVLSPGAEPLGEDAPTAPLSAYARAKELVESISRVRPDKLDVVVARVFGSVGPGLPRGLFVPDVLARIASGESRIWLAGADARRDLLDGRDVADALVALMTTREARGTFHVGSGSGVRLSEVAAQLATACGRACTFEFAPGEGAGWIADPSRIIAATGWRPRRTLTDAIEWTVREEALASRAAP